MTSSRGVGCLGMSSTSKFAARRDLFQKRFRMIRSRHFYLRYDPSS
jgi:hypothetical protein